jgi:quercetin dioxygenase-like cupin family protein
MLELTEHPDGVMTEPGNRIVYDLARNEAHHGAAQVDGHAVVWELTGDPQPGEWVLRCDRVDFPPGGVAYRHVHPGPGIRRLLFGELTIESPEETQTYRAGESWFEGADHPVLATASPTEDTAFVRVLLLPAEWAGKRTIRYVDPADEEKPKLQRATIYLERPVGP